ncbi:LPS export ABC transporter periplasmic protein LptC [Pseudaestuariivita rosea]|uniref:LPS export ABC transporter periplasmic protein LptC n=1 Tax=Pseudaestuariivita rosea TaxID=2763263 RepID=UPI001ABA387F|nr:LPS export ABC transporter periplasmic protein LptC [Pseudaestuariivita rosea]
MATYDNAYSRFVAFVKIVLPLAALALLSTLFLFSRPQETDLTIPYAEVEAIAREQIIGEPTYTGVTRDGSAIAIGAKSARPQHGNTSHMLADEIVAVIQMPGGTIYDINATAGRVDTSSRQAFLSGGVQIVTSDGYDIQTRGIVTSLSQTNLQSDGAVSAEGPLGTLDAGGMHMTGTGTDEYLLVFNKGVKLVYTPAN